MKIKILGFLLILIGFVAPFILSAIFPAFFYPFILSYLFFVQVFF